MPTTPSKRDLDFVKDEVKGLKSLLPSCVVLENPTKADVLSILPDQQIAHFSCHGYSSAADPSQSRLLLRDWKTSPLIVSDIAALNFQGAQLCFLSACHSARVRDINLLDESLNLAFAFHLAGYPSVVGSLWQVTPGESAAVANDVYTSMLVGDGKLDTRRSAEGLHRAARLLREKSSAIPGLAKKVANPLVWAPYIHLGV
jgi:CHAT domain-containing protein